jgi:murein DD-endopeptidase MepM/ murein hydrolase activator NlpD
VVSRPLFGSLRVLPPLLCLLTASLIGRSEEFLLPTANRAIFEPGGEDRFFAATPGKTWVSGTFGCVRSDGWQIHEGLDIRSLQRDRRGEPTDPVMAAADGAVAYINSRPSLSNYGNYIVLRHEIEGLEVYTLYAHLHSIRAGLQLGQTVRAGEAIAIMGRTANTRESISRDRAHVHFEIDMLVNDRFAEWFKRTSPGERNDHGCFNGQNLNGIDPRLILLEQHRLGDHFSLVNYIESEPELCRVFVRSAGFPWLKRYAPLVSRNPVAEKEGIAGYEIALDYNGVAIHLIPRAASEIRGKGKYILLSVNEAEEKKNPARRLVIQRGGRWELANHGLNLLELMTF